MFSYEEIQKYNETDICIYKYIVSNIDKVQYMTIRELAKAIHISTSTILRFCNKNNFEGYSDFKEALKKEIVWDHPAHSQNMEQDILQIWDILQ